jgi:hypothetical protein
MAAEDNTVLQANHIHHNKTTNRCRYSKQLLHNMQRLKQLHADLQHIFHNTSGAAALLQQKRTIPRNNQNMQPALADNGTQGCYRFTPSQRPARSGRMLCCYLKFFVAAPTH